VVPYDEGMVAAIAQIVVAVTLLGAILAGIIGLIYPIPADKLNEQPYMLIPWISFASLALGVIGWIGLLWLWARQAQAKVAGPTRRLGAMVLLGVRTARRVRVGIRLFVLPDEAKPAVRNRGEGGVKVLPTPAKGPKAPGGAAAAILKREAAKAARSAAAQPSDIQSPPVTAADASVADDPWHGPRLFQSGVFWNGHPNYHCPYCGHAVVDDPDEIQRHVDATHGLADLRAADDFYDDPQPWADVAVHFVDDGSRRYHGGVPADERRTIYVSPRRADELTAAGLYERGVTPYEIRSGANSFGYTDRFARQVELAANAEGLLVPRSGSEAKALAGAGLPRLPNVVAADADTLVRELRDFIGDNPPPFPSLVGHHELPPGATAQEMRQFAESEQRFAGIYRERFAQRVAVLLGELDQHELGGGAIRRILDDTGIAWATLGRVANALAEAAMALRQEPSGKQNRRPLAHESSAAPTSSDPF
jgi:hypothetical protein